MTWVNTVVLEVKGFSTFWKKKKSFLFQRSLGYTCSVHCLIWRKNKNNFFMNKVFIFYLVYWYFSRESCWVNKLAQGMGRNNQWAKDLQVNHCYSQSTLSYWKLIGIVVCSSEWKKLVYFLYCQILRLMVYSEQNHRQRECTVILKHPASLLFYFWTQSCMRGWV